MSEQLSDTSERTEHSVAQEKTKAQRKHQRNKANEQAKRLAEEIEAEVLKQAKHQAEAEAEAETASRQQESEELEEVQKAKKKRHHRGKKRRKSKNNTDSDPDANSYPDAGADSDSDAITMAEPVADLTPEEREKAKKKAKRDRRWENQKARDAEAGLGREDTTTDEPAVNNRARKAAMKARKEQGDQHAGGAAGTEMASAEPADTEKPISTPGALAPPHLQSMSSPTTPIKGTRNITPLSPLVQQGEKLEDYAASSDCE